MKTSLLVSLPSCTLAAACLGALVAAASPADVIVDWNLVMASTIEAAPSTTPANEDARTYALVHLAMYRAVHAATRSNGPAPTVPMIEAQVAASVAAHGVLVARIPRSSRKFDRALSSQLEKIPESPAREGGLVLGREAIASTLERWGDESASGWATSDAPGNAPSADISLAISLPSLKTFRAGAPYVLDEAGCHLHFNPAPAFDSILKRMRAADPEATVRLWNNPSVLVWNRIARAQATSSGAGLLATARLFAVLNVAIADATLAARESQAHFAVRRTIKLRAEAVAANLRANDTNLNPIARFLAADPDTELAGAFTGLVEVTVPPLANYPSTGAAADGAAAAVLRESFRDNLKKIVVTEPMPRSGESGSREFATFDEAARECALVPVLTGGTFREAAISGYEQGSGIGRWIFKHAKNFVGSDAQ